MAHEFGELKRKVVSGAFLAGGAQVARQLLQLGAVALLARWLGPRPYGVLAMAVSVLGLAQIFADLGLGSAAARDRAIEPARDATLFRLSLLAAAATYLVVEVAAPWIAGLFAEPAMTAVLRAVAPGFLLVGALQTRRAALLRELRFRATAAIELFAVAAGIAASVAAAASGLRVGALVLGSLVQQVAWCAAVLLLAGVPPAAPFRLAAVRADLRYGLPLTGFNLVNYFARTLDNMLVGGLMGAIALGLYEKAYALMMLPVTQIAAAFAQVLHPALSSVREERDRLAFLYLGAVRKMAGLAFPAAALCIAAAGPVVRLLLGPRFEGAVPIFATLSLVMAIQPIFASAGWLYMATGRTGRMFLWGTVNAAVLCGCIVAGALRGRPLDVARAYAIGSAALFLPTLFVATRTAGIRLRDVLARIAAPAVAAAAAAFAGTRLPSGSFAATVAVVGVVYVGVHLALDRRALFDLLRFLDPRRAFHA